MAKRFHILTGDEYLGNGIYLNDTEITVGIAKHCYDAKHDCRQTHTNLKILSVSQRNKEKNHG